MVIRELVMKLHQATHQHFRALPIVQKTHPHLQTHQHQYQTAMEQVQNYHVAQNTVHPDIVQLDMDIALAWLVIRQHPHHAEDITHRTAVR